MKRMFIAIFFVMVMALNSAQCLTSNNVTYSDGKIFSYQEKEIGIHEEYAIKVSDTDQNLIENDEEQDTGSVQINWNPEVYCTYGCSLANLIYENPISSNKAVQVSIVIPDEILIENFGSTFRTKDECMQLALEGLSVLKSGCNDYQSADNLAQKGFIPYEYVKSDVSITPEELVNLIVTSGILEMTTEELFSLNEVNLAGFSEIKLLSIAQLGKYSFKKNYQVIAETGIIEAGHAVYNLPFYTFSDNITLSQGRYSGKFVIKVYDKTKGKYSDVSMTIPAIIMIEKNLPSSICKEYGITLASKVK